MSRSFLLLGVLLLSGCSGFKYQPNPSIDGVSRPGAIKFDERSIFYRVVNPDKNLPPLVLIHGSPGDLYNYRYFLTNPQLQDKYKIISIDRPGFGHSGNGKPERSLVKQAQAVKKVLDAESAGQPAVVLGHSYGGSVAARLAMDYPQQVSGLILAAAAVDPQLERNKWFQYPANVFFVRWVLPNALDVANQEICALKEELQEMAPLWNRITAPTLIVHGGKDELVPVENAHYAQQKITNAPVSMAIAPEGNHFVIWNRATEIITYLLTFDQGRKNKLLVGQKTDKSD